jgi:O-antigen/teichoic acid export membrane protein
MQKQKTTKAESIIENKIPVCQPKEDLRQRAYLNTIASWVDTGTKFVVVFFMNPIIISSLGATLFGVWQIISQMNSYMATVDLRSGTSVKWFVARNRTTTSSIELKKTMSAAVYANLIFLPLYILAGAVMVWLAPSVSHVKDEYSTMVRVATGLIALAFIINQYAFLLQSVLAGMNLSFKRIGIQSTLTILGGGATVVLLHFGYGLSSMAVVQIVTAIATGLVFWWTLKKHVDWFGFVKVNLRESFSFVKLTGKFMAHKTVSTINGSNDLILLGYFAGPKYVGSYVVTRYLVQATSRVIGNVISAVTPGLGRLVGEGNYSKLFEARNIMITFSWLFLAITGVAVLLWNKSFVSIWTDLNLYVGDNETFLIVLIASLNIIQQIDAGIITMTLDIRNQIILIAVSASLSMSMAIILIPKFHIMGLLIGMLSGSLIITICSSIIAQKKVNGKRFLQKILLSRTAIVSLSLLFGAGYFGRFFKVSSWWALISVLLLTLISTIILWLLTVTVNDRKIVLNNLKRIKIFRFTKA